MKRGTLFPLAMFLLAACGERPDERPARGAEAEPPAVDVAQEAQRIQDGMTEAQVVQILGEPRTRVGESEGERLTFWTFGPDGEIRARVYVTLDAGGKVVNVETIPL